MQPHIKNYMNHHGYHKGDFIPCEVCRSEAVDIHHLVPRSKFGKNRKTEQDAPANLIALCRKHHDLAHSDKAFNDSLKIYRAENVHVNK